MLAILYYNYTTASLTLLHVVFQNLVNSLERFRIDIVVMLTLDREIKSVAGVLLKECIRFYNS